MFLAVINQKQEQGTLTCAYWTHTGCLQRHFCQSNVAARVQQMSQTTHLTSHAVQLATGSCKKIIWIPQSKISARFGLSMKGFNDKRYQVLSEHTPIPSQGFSSYFYLLTISNKEVQSQIWTNPEWCHCACCSKYIGNELCPGLMLNGWGCTCMYTHLW